MKGEVEGELHGSLLELPVCPWRVGTTQMSLLGKKMSHSLSITNLQPTPTPGRRQCSGVKINKPDLNRSFPLSFPRAVPFPLILPFLPALPLSSPYQSCLHTTLAPSLCIHNQKLDSPRSKTLAFLLFYLFAGGPHVVNDYEPKRDPASPALLCRAAPGNG